MSSRMVNGDAIAKGESKSKEESAVGNHIISNGSVVEPHLSSKKIRKRNSAEYHKPRRCRKINLRYSYTCASVLRNGARQSDLTPYLASASDGTDVVNLCIPPRLLISCSRCPGSSRGSGALCVKCATLISICVGSSTWHLYFQRFMWVGVRIDRRLCTYWFGPPPYIPMR